MSSRLRAAVLVGAAFLLIAANFLFTANYVNSTLAASQKAAAANHQAAAANQKAAAADAAQVTSCQSANALRADTVDLWTFIIHLSKPPGTADQRRVLAEFEHHLRLKFAPRPCALPPSLKGNS